MDDIVSAGRGKPVTFVGKISAPVNNIPPVLNYPKIHYKDHFIKGAPGGSVQINMKEKRDQKNGFRAN